MFLCGRWEGCFKGGGAGWRLVAPPSAEHGLAGLVAVDLGSDNRSRRFGSPGLELRFLPLREQAAFAPNAHGSGGSPAVPHWVSRCVWGERPERWGTHFFRNGYENVLWD